MEKVWLAQRENALKARSQAECSMATWHLKVWRFELNPSLKVLDDDYNDVEDDEIVVVDEDVDDKIVADDYDHKELKAKWSVAVSHSRF